MRGIIKLAAMVASTALAGQSGAGWAAPDTRPSIAADFAIGTQGPGCHAQGTPLGQARNSVFERKWSILCADVSLPVGAAYALRGADTALDRVAALRAEPLACGDAAAALSAEGLTCTAARSGLAWRVYARRTAHGMVIVEGLAAYDAALRLALASLEQDRLIAGSVGIANLGAGESMSLVKARARQGDAGTLLGQGYRGNNAGAYAEAAEFFATAPTLFDDTVTAGDPDSDASLRDAVRHEALVNRALQQSNLGAYAQARRLFDEAGAMHLMDPVQARLARNYAAIDAINRGNLDEALVILARPVPPFVSPAAPDGSVRIDGTTARGLNSTPNTPMSALLGQPTRLSPQDRATLIDAQARQLRGTVRRLQGDYAKARDTLAGAYGDAMAVQDGRVVSITRLRAQILSEQALSEESLGQNGAAEGHLRDALAMVQQGYPDSTSVNVVRARLAGFLARRGQQPEALTIYRALVDDVTARQGVLVGMENLMRPYFDLLAGPDGQGTQDTAAVAALFEAAQLLESPAAADSLAQLSRQLEGGSDEAAALYRDSQGIARALERSRIDIARLSAAADGGAAVAAQIATLRAQQDQLAQAQVALMARLSAYPRYRAVASRTVPLAELQAALTPGEGYLKLLDAGGAAYAVYLDRQTARAWKIGLSAAAIDQAVNTLRDSISLSIGGVQSTYPFDVDSAVALDQALLGPARAEIDGLSHLVFEPGGAMLKLPINLLTDDAKGVAAYHTRVADGGDEYDFTGIRWLGRTTQVSTALSAASFRDARKAPASTARRGYLGLGDNLAVGPIDKAQSIRSADPAAPDADCQWPLSAWNRPISDAELKDAAHAFAAGSAELVTGAGFTDNAIKARGDLDGFRVVHFATHGLVTAPHSGCPARPALLTSFGGAGSDGLLSFGEIFDLRLDADLVVLSACDTASGAGFVATQEAGLSTGSDQALDGLVRAFIAAGGRQVIASHWPAPDDYNATRRLFQGFYQAHGTSIGGALMAAQRKLMDDPETSHPYYWAGFAIVGDAARPAPAR
ncbi:CHAT domain-containing protein [Novosphingobium colocasiae]|uniref:CHAT domain-containing protein n=1 Tax=Novosphingobium colocasiae TaxID=1256513 RepID=UPI0035AF26A6